MAQHKRHVVERYEIDTLGAPFKVVLLNAVTFNIDPKTGEEKINVPDVNGLIGAVVRARVSHPRKLNGKEIRFIRNALGMKANQICKFLDMTPEHFSRCEKGTKVMAILSEKMFRLFAHVATYFPDPQDLVDVLNGKTELSNTDVTRKAKKPEEMASKFVEQFLTMKILPAFDTAEELGFELAFQAKDKPRKRAKTKPHENEDEWKVPEPVAACAGGRR